MESRNTAVAVSAGNSFPVLMRQAREGRNLLNLEEVSNTKEVTRITTLRITEIVRDTDEAINATTTDEAKQYYRETLQNTLKTLGVDDVVVDNVQGFIMDVNE